MAHKQCHRSTTSPGNSSVTAGVRGTRYRCHNQPLGCSARQQDPFKTPQAHATATVHSWQPKMCWMDGPSVNSHYGSGWMQHWVNPVPHAQAGRGRQSTELLHDRFGRGHITTNISMPTLPPPKKRPQSCCGQPPRSTEVRMNKV